VLPVLVQPRASVLSLGDSVTVSVVLACPSGAATPHIADRCETLARVYFSTVNGIRKSVIASSVGTVTRNEVSRATSDQSAFTHSLR
jgi:hypothetical protein